MNIPLCRLIMSIFVFALCLKFPLAGKAEKPPEQDEKYNLAAKLIQDHLFTQEINESKTWEMTLMKGLSNYNYRVSSSLGEFFVRLGGENFSSSLGIDRVKEYAIYQRLKEDKITPELIYFDCVNGNLISSFISGTHYGKVRGKWLYEKESSIANMINLMKKYHKHTSSLEEEIDYPFEIIQKYLEKAHQLSVALPQDMDEVINIVQKIKLSLPSQPKVLCHQDLFPTNFIYDGEKLYLIDWEYAHWSDPFYDLASLCVQNQFDREEKEIALTSYFGLATSQHKTHLEMMCMLYSMRSALWCFNQNQNMADKSFDFLKLANMHYNNFFISYRWLLNEMGEFSISNCRF